jgi:hypothetical protein
MVLEYVRQVLLRTSPGTKINAKSELETQPDTIDMNNVKLPKVFANLNNQSLGEHGKKFEDLKVGELYKGTFEKSISLVDFSWLQISTLNDASVHHTPSSNFIGYGGAIKSTVEGSISEHIPHAYFIGMNSGSHDAPTYPGDIVQNMFASEDNNDEKINGSFKIIEKLDHESREDFGIVKIELIGEKTITEASMKAYEKSGFKGIGNIKDEKIRVLTMEMLLAVPKGVAFQ